MNSMSLHMLRNFNCTFCNSREALSTSTLVGNRKETNGFPANIVVDGTIKTCQVFRNEEIFQYADDICQDFPFPRGVTLLLLLNRKRILRIVLESLREKIMIKLVLALLNNLMIFVDSRFRTLMPRILKKPTYSETV